MSIKFVILLFILFFISRLFQLTNLPIFSDEAIYIRWGQLANFDASLRFISLSDGKQPLFIWLMIPFIRYIHDPLLAGRLVSVFAGFLTMVGLYILTYELFKNRFTAIISSILYIFYPFALLLDRMALYDSLVGTFSVWSLYLLVLLVKHVRLDVALILGMILGGGLLSKSSLSLSIYLSPLTLLLFNFKKEIKFKRLAKWMMLLFISILLSYLYYSILHLSDKFYMIGEKNSMFIYHYHELIPYKAFFLWPENLLMLADWMLDFITIPIFILALSSFFIVKDFLREKLLLALWFFIPFVLIALWGRVFYSRFIFFMSLPLLPLAALSLHAIFKRVKNMGVFILLFLIIIFPMIYADYFILTNLSVSPIPTHTKNEFINNWPAGGGIKEVVKFLDEESQKNSLYVATEGIYGSLPTTSLEIFLSENKNIERQALLKIPSKIPNDLIQKACTMDVYLLINQLQTPPQWPLELIAKYQKGIGKSYLSLFKIKKPPNDRCLHLKKDV